LSTGKAKGLHLVPVRLKQALGFGRDVREAYDHSYVDGLQRNDNYPDYLVLGNGVTAEYCTVAPMYLEIDVPRVREMVHAYTTGDTSALLGRAIQCAFAALDRRDRPMPVVPWTPGPERFAEPELAEPAHA
jgi:hypothetical protein